MQIKTIEHTVRKKMEEWITSIHKSDPQLAADTRKSLLVSGGSICSLFLGEPVNDYDVYIQDIDVLKRLCLYYAKGFDIDIWDGREKDQLIKRLEARGIYLIGQGRASSALRNLNPDQIKIFLNGADETGGLTVNQDIPDEDRNYIPMHFSPNAISLSNDLQIVVRFWGPAETVHKYFDFVHATNYFSFGEGLVRKQAALESILTKTLRYQGSMYPITSIVRAKKFIKRGFGMSAGEYLKIMFQISQLDLQDLDVLEEQILSIDVAYFSTLVDALRKKKEKEPNFIITTEYLSVLLDRIFNEDHEDAE